MAITIYRFNQYINNYIITKLHKKVIVEVKNPLSGILCFKVVITHIIIKVHDSTEI